MASAMAIRTEAIEFATWRSGLIGGSAWSITLGKERLFEENGAAGS